jgi:hypothetical protein
VTPGLTESGKGGTSRTAESPDSAGQTEKRRPEKQRPRLGEADDPPTKPGKIMI